MSLRDLEMFLESLESMKEIVNPRELTSPEAHRVRGVARREKKKKDSSREISTSLSKRADLHAQSPLKKGEREVIKMKIDKVYKNTKNNKSDVHIFNLDKMEGDEPNWRNLDDVTGITPDHLYVVAGQGRQAVTWIYFPKTDELFFTSTTPMDIESGKEDRNYNLGKVDDGGGVLKTHSSMVNRIITLSRHDALVENDWFYGPFKDKVISVSDKMIMGRYYDGIMSIWNNMDEGKYKKIVDRLVKVHPTISKVKQLWMNEIKNDRR
jgi:hypothetical protein